MDPGQKKTVPLSLEDSCLAWLISDLEHYPPELLALLPLRLCYCLLANLPVLDLCQFEHNPVAVGVDLDNIWRMKFPPKDDAQVQSMLSTDKVAKLYHLSDQDQARSQIFLKGGPGSKLKGGAKRRRKFLLINFHKGCGQ